MKLNPRKPDFIVKVLDKISGSKSNRIGAAWKNADGSFDIVLDDYIAINQDGGKLIKLFPNDRL